MRLEGTDRKAFELPATTVAASAGVKVVVKA
jgi:hypothetical protein